MRCDNDLQASTLPSMFRKVMLGLLQIMASSSLTVCCASVLVGCGESRTSSAWSEWSSANAALQHRYQEIPQPTKVDWSAPDFLDYWWEHVPPLNNALVTMYRHVPTGYVSIVVRHVDDHGCLHVAWVHIDRYGAPLAFRDFEMLPSPHHQLEVVCSAAQSIISQSGRTGALVRQGFPIQSFTANLQHKTYLTWIPLSQTQYAEMAATSNRTYPPPVSEDSQAWFVQGLPSASVELLVRAVDSVSIGSSYSGPN